jgi:glycerophosphoryl diester phosphodiesterase
MPRLLFFLAALGPLALPCTADPVYHHDINARQCCVVIAHAGGGIGGAAYTNSEEAMLSHLAAGVRVFEIDFAKTHDGVWVGTHDWALWKRQTRHEGRLPPAYHEFTVRKLKPPEAQTAAAAYTGITIAFLEKAVATHGDIVIVTDTKYDLEGLARALRETKLFPRIYPQAYSPRDVDILAGLGFRRIILTVYKMDLGQPEKWLGHVAAMAERLHALTVPLDFFAKHHHRLTKLGLPVYVHGPPAHINSRALHRRLWRLGVAGFYLDW